MIQREAGASPPEFKMRRRQRANSPSASQEGRMDEFSFLEPWKHVFFFFPLWGCGGNRRDERVSCSHCQVRHLLHNCLQNRSPCFNSCHRQATSVWGKKANGIHQKGTPHHHPPQGWTSARCCLAQLNTLTPCQGASGRRRGRNVARVPLESDCCELFFTPLFHFFFFFFDSSTIKINTDLAPADFYEWLHSSRGCHQSTAPVLARSHAPSGNACAETGRADRSGI